MKFSLVYISLLLVLSGCSDNPHREKICQKVSSTISIKENNLEVINSCSEEAITQGLMNIKKLNQNAGMLFVFPVEQTLNFWMKNTYIPLDVAYINNDLEIIDIQTMKPLDETVISSKSMASFALEVNAGWFEKNRIKIGDKVIIK